MPHFQDLCKHGVTVSQCRCVGLKETHIVDCPDHCPERDKEPSRCDVEPHPRGVDVSLTEDELYLVWDGLAWLSSASNPNMAKQLNALTAKIHRIMREMGSDGE